MSGGFIESSILLVNNVGIAMKRNLRSLLIMFIASVSVVCVSKAESNLSESVLIGEYHLLGSHSEVTLMLKDDGKYAISHRTTGYTESGVWAREERSNEETSGLYINLKTSAKKPKQFFERFSTLKLSYIYDCKALSPSISSAPSNQAIFIEKNVLQL